MKKRIMAMIFVCLLLSFNGTVVMATDMAELQLNEETSGQTREPKAASLYTGRLLDYPGVQVIGGSDSIPAKYSFMPDLFNSTSQAFGSGVTDLESHYRFDLSAVDLGATGVLYENVGSYKGTDLSMLVTITGTTDNTRLLDLYKQDMRLSITGSGGVKLNYTYLELGSDVVVPVAGYHNFNDIDLSQYVRIYNDMNVSQMYSTPDNGLSYYAGSDYFEVGDAENVSSSSTDKSQWLNYTYDETTNFSLLFGCAGYADFYYTFEALMPIAQPVTVKYTDEAGNEIAPADTLSGYLGEEYNAEPKEIEGYTLSESPNNVNGSFTEQKQTVIFVYKVAPSSTPTPTPTQTPTPTTQGTVKVLYVDQSDNELEQSDIISGNVGETYVTKAKEISGYALVQEPDNMAGIFTIEEQTVKFIYKAIPDETAGVVNEQTKNTAFSTTYLTKTSPSLTKTAPKTGDSSLNGAVMHFTLLLLSAGIVISIICKRNNVKN